MTDVLTPEQRRLCMSRIRGRDTKPEMIVRSLVHRMGYRFRLHCRDLPGKPDLVFSSRKKVIFVHGCFWHRHACRFGRVMPKTRRAFWQNKLEGNAERDRRTRARLHREGWRVLVIWGCQVKDAERLAGRLSAFLGQKTKRKSI